MSDKNFKIGDVKLSNQLVLAPMLAVNCAAFRLMCKQYGAGLVVSPMIHSLGLVKAEGHLEAQMDYLKEERPLSVQIVGRDPDIMAESLQYIEEYADIIDMNFGCPDKDILGQKMGAYFSKHPEQMEKIISKVVSATNKPVTAKIRIGWDSQQLNQNIAAKIVEDCGCAAIAVHGRTMKQRYTGKANWESIKQVKDKVNIPVIGNGDVWMAEDAQRMIERTGCDFVMAGRGAIGNPYLFKRCDVLLNHKKKLPDPSEQQKGKMLLDFISLYSKVQPVKRFSELRQQAMWFCTGSRAAAVKRNAFMRVQDEDELVSEIHRLFRL